MVAEVAGILKRCCLFAVVVVVVIGGGLLVFLFDSLILSGDGRKGAK